MPANHNLRALRESRNITVLDVELKSRRISETKSDKWFHISNTRLTQLENDPLSEIGICELFSLSAIYHIRMTELMRLYFNLDVEELDKYNLIAFPNKTQLLSEVPEAYRTTELLTSLVKDKTTLLPGKVLSANDRPDVPIPDPDSQYISYGYIGLDDFTMDPLIRPGSYVQVDTRQNKLLLIPWRTEYKRPIYFVELQDGYACSWCELQGSQLLVVPYHSSHVSVRRFHYPKEAEIVGRVIGFDTDCVDEDSVNQKDPNSRNNLR